MKKIILILFTLFVSSLSAQTIWKKLKKENFKGRTDIYSRENKVMKYDLFSMDIESFKNHIKIQGGKLEIPRLSGEIETFIVNESSNFEEGLTEKFPQIKSYTARGIDSNEAVAQISVGTDGIHLAIMSNEHTTQYIDPYTENNNTYISYERKNAARNKNDFECKVNKLESNFKDSNKIFRDVNDSSLRTYRLALACTIEYSQFHLNNQKVDPSATIQMKRAAVLSAMNTTMTRVNGVFENDLAVRMILVSDNERIIHIDSDDLDNGDAHVLIDESQRVCDNIIGDSNYDIGHTFSTGAGGLAQSGLCERGYKAKGVTGKRSPIGDTFDIDYVAHEIGHQFGADHTFNNSCDGNRSGSTSVEPGSGSTIMGYAGICDPDIQNNSNDYFHAVSIKQMWGSIKNSSCATITNTNNRAPIVKAGNDVSIPKLTPFVLRGEATDDDGTSLTYTWEQIDTEIASMPPVETNTGGPLFRSLPPSRESDRYFPKLSAVISKENDTWEVLPSVEREMNFSLVVRDNNSGGGSNSRDDIKIKVIDTDPFEVTSPSTSVTWDKSIQTVTWNKGSTNISPINCSNVKIRLSTDGGITFPIILAESTPNDGTENIVLPSSIKTTKARIMVEAVGNVFYNVNSINFTVDSPILINSNSNKFSIYPNPSDGNITLTLDIGNEAKTKVDLYNTNGKQVFTKEYLNSLNVFLENISFNVSSGIYLLQIDNGGKKLTKTIIIE